MYIYIYIYISNMTVSNPGYNYNYPRPASDIPIWQRCYGSRGVFQIQPAGLQRLRESSSDVIVAGLVTS